MILLLMWNFEKSSISPIDTLFGGYIVCHSSGKWQHLGENYFPERETDPKMTKLMLICTLRGLITRLSVLIQRAVWWEHGMSRSIVYLTSALWLDTESLGFNAEVLRWGQFQIRLLIPPSVLLQVNFTLQKIIHLMIFFITNYFILIFQWDYKQFHRNMIHFETMIA